MNKRKVSLYIAAFAVLAACIVAVVFALGGTPHGKIAEIPSAFRCGVGIAACVAFVCLAIAEKGWK